MTVSRSSFPPGIKSLVSGTATSITTSTAVEIATPATSGRTALMITNGDSSDDMWVGDSSVAVGRGVRVASGQSIAMQALDVCRVYVIGGTGTISAVGWLEGVS